MDLSVVDMLRSRPSGSPSGLRDGIMCLIQYASWYRSGARDRHKVTGVHCTLNL